VKKILIFSTNYLPNLGGAEVSVKEITDRIGTRAEETKQEFRFDMVVPRISKKLPRVETIGKVHVFRVGIGSFIDKFTFPIFGFLKARKLHIHQGYDLTWSIMASQASIAASFFKIAYPKVKLVLTLQEGDEEDYLKRYVLNIDWLYKILIRPWHLLVFKKADFVTAISEYLKRRAIGNGVSVPIEIIPNGVDYSRFSKKVLRREQEKVKIELQEMHGKISDVKYLITVSRLVIKNGIADVIESMAHLPQNIVFIVIGGGELEEKMKSLAKIHNVEKRVLFFGSVPNDQILKYLSVSDCFIRPSLSEGFGVSFIEAMAAGIPVIATPVGGIVDFLKDEKTGLLCQVGNPRDIAFKIERVLNQEELKDEIISNAKKMVEEKYDWRGVSIKMKELFNKLIENK
jgi:glycosyltransferase involved in cell wall biosynthesis